LRLLDQEADSQVPTSTAQLVDATASIVQDGLRCRGMQRALQLAEVLPKHPRVHDATEIEAIHAAAWGLAILWTGRQSHAPAGVAKVYHLPPKDHTGWRHPALQPDDANMIRRTSPEERAASFGEALFAIIDLAAASLALVPPMALVASAVYALGARLRSTIDLEIVGGYLGIAFFMDLLRSALKLPNWTQHLSIFTAYGTPIADGVNWTSISVMLLLAALFTGIGVYLFQTGDIRQGG